METLKLWYSNVHNNERWVTTDIYNDDKHLPHSDESHIKSDVSSFYNFIPNKM